MTSAFDDMERIKKEKQEDSSKPLIKRTYLYSTDKGTISDYGSLKDPTSTVLFRYDRGLSEPKSIQFPSRDRFYTTMASLIRNCGYENTTFDTFRGYDFFGSNFGFVKDATTVFDSFLVDQHVDPKIKSVVAFLTSPLSKVSNNDLDMLVENLRESRIAVESTSESMLLDRLANNLEEFSSTTEGFILSHMGKRDTEYNLWQADETELGTWYGYDYLAKNIFDPLSKQRFIVPTIGRSWSHGVNNEENISKGLSRSFNQLIEVGFYDPRLLEGFFGIFEFARDNEIDFNPSTTQLNRVYERGIRPNFNYSSNRPNFDSANSRIAEKIEKISDELGISIDKERIIRSVYSSFKDQLISDSFIKFASQRGIDLSD